MIPYTVPPPMIQSAEQVVPLKEAVEKVLQDFDMEDPALPLRNPEVARKDQPPLRWLRSAALSDIPENPFRKGTNSSSEAEALLTLLKTDRDQAKTIETLLLNLKMKEPGTAMALWRWAKRQERIKPWNSSTRQIWEDKLMAGSAPAMLNGYALRHALCWALADKDEARFAALKAVRAQDAPTLFAPFQGLFGWFGEISPVMRLWVMPGLEYQDRRLDTLLAFDGSKPSRIWISPESDPPQKLPTHTAWIVPTEAGSQTPDDTTLSQVELSAGTGISKRLAAAKGLAYLAPSRTEFESLGLVFFPIIIELDSKGAIQSIRMGDAAPQTP
ncbi:MAG: hypothetical protein IPP78_00660 [Holophagaceae bacterium]|nr:hypothetical protein [Holophagaceae bacterium]